MLIEIFRKTVAGLLLPFFDSAGARLQWEMREDNVAGGSVHEVDNRASFDIKAWADGRVGLGNDDDLSAFEHAKVAGLIELVNHILHNRQRLGDETFGGRVFQRHAKDLEGQAKAVVIIIGPSNVTALLQADEHAEDLGDGAVEAAGNVALGQAGWLMSEKFEDVEPFFQGGCRVTPFCHFQDSYPG